MPAAGDFTQVLEWLVPRGGRQGTSQTWYNASFGKLKLKLSSGCPASLGKQCGVTERLKAWETIEGDPSLNPSSADKEPCNPGK